MPYFGAQSEELKKEVLKLLTKYVPNYSFKFVLVNNFTIGSLFPFKDRLPSHMQASLVYKFSCSRCESMYIGSTCRTLGARVAEHMGRSYSTNSILANPSHSSIREHSFSCDSLFNIQNFSVLKSCSKLSDLRLLESLFINKLKPNLNEMRSATPLYIVSQ